MTLELELWPVDACHTGGVWNENDGLVGVGYEGRSIDEFVEGLAAWQVTKLVDVRLTPLSRKRGFSKTALKAALESADIEYVHMPELGNLKDNRDGYAERATPAADRARAQYVERIETPSGQQAISAIAQWASASRVALLCFEANERNCHREQIIERVLKSMLVEA
ncbi:DUF488 family protein [Plantibacter sp. YIM 135249]|uniref:DUF488 domain-containing protein n=1 Tax=Plantibacter sp. YIM 135249 TaxID=3423918 RepID=UPI003D351DF2